MLTNAPADDMGDTPLHLAASHGNAEVAKLLILAGADPSIKNKARLLLPVNLIYYWFSGI
jgi:ankyrin repeat protein